MTQHTPGPWYVKGCVPVGKANRHYDIIAGRSLLAAAFPTNDANAADNAALIAAAPDLLNMCERLLGFAHHYADASALLAGEGMLASAKALIAKAKGGAA